MYKDFLDLLETLEELDNLVQSALKDILEELATPEQQDSQDCRVQPVQPVGQGPPDTPGGLVKLEQQDLKDTQEHQLPAFRVRGTTSTRTAS